MWNVLKSEMRMPVFAAAACAAVMLVASPVAAEPPTRDSAADAVKAYRAYLKSEAMCKYDLYTGKAKSGAGKCVINNMNAARQGARAAKQECIDAGGTAKQCQEAAYLYWVNLVP